MIFPTDGMNAIQAQVGCEKYIEEIVASRIQKEMRDDIIDMILEMQQEWYFHHEFEWDLAASSALQSLLYKITNKYGGKGAPFIRR